MPYTLEQWMRLSFDKRVKVVVNGEAWKIQEAKFREQTAHIVLQLLATQSEGATFDQLQGKMFTETKIIGARGRQSSVEQYKDQQMVTELLEWVIQQLASRRFLDHGMQGYEITDLGKRHVSTKKPILSR